MSTVRDQIRVALEDEGLDGVMAVFTSWLSFQLAAEREACCQDVCEGCREGWPLIESPGYWVHEVVPGRAYDVVAGTTRPGWLYGCRAHAIRARGAREAQPGSDSPSDDDLRRIREWPDV